MSKQLPLIIIFLLSYINVSSQQSSIEHDGNNRSYLVHLPLDYTQDKIYPLVIAMHGGTGSAENLERQSRLSDKSDEENFIVVYPEGLADGLFEVRTWNAGLCCGHSAASNVDDVGFIEKLVMHIIEEYSVDQDRVYATGMSNGGYMAYRLACEKPELFAAIAPVACSMTFDCEPSQSMPIIQFHSLEDKNVLLGGGSGEGLSVHYSPPIDSVINVWATNNSCQIKDDTIINDEKILQIRWSDCDCNSNIDLYVSTDGGHSWPGGMKTPLGDPTSDYLDANELMWNFFSSHSLACRNNLSNISQDNSALKIEIYPNPTSDFFILNMPDSPLNFSVSVYDINGRLRMSKKDQKIIPISLESGIYILSIELGNNKYSARRLVVTN